MRAENGKRYAQIIDSKVHWLFDITTLPEWQDSAFEVVDVTDQTQVVEGYIHHGGQDFSPPPAVVPPTEAELDDRAARAQLTRLDAQSIRHLRVMADAGASVGAKSAAAAALGGIEIAAIAQRAKLIGAE